MPEKGIAMSLFGKCLEEAASETTKQVGFGIGSIIVAAIVGMMVQAALTPERPVYRYNFDSGTTYYYYYDRHGDLRRSIFRSTAKAKSTSGELV
jgi:hypothetical protein